jgi:serine/threonine protein kinase
MFQALAAVHDRNVIHLDIKPENLIIDRAAVDTPEAALLGGREIRFIDWGGADLCEHSVPCRLTGTPYRFPPEMVSGRCLTKASDIWTAAFTIIEAVEQCGLENIVFSDADDDVRKMLHDQRFVQAYMAKGLRSGWLHSKQWQSEVGQIRE